MKRTFKTDYGIMTLKEIESLNKIFFMDVYNSLSENDKCLFDKRFGRDLRKEII